MKYIQLVFIAFLIFFAGCGVKNQCAGFSSDREYFRSNAMVASSNANIARERALFGAKQLLAEEIDKYIISKLGDSGVDSAEYSETRIITARQTVLNNVNIICNRHTMHKGRNYGHVAIEVSKTDVDDILVRTFQIKQK